MRFWLLLLVSTTASAQALYELPADIETRWASPENPRGERGRGGEVNAGRKGAAHFPLAAGASRVLAEVSGGSGTVRRIWMTMQDRSPKMLRGMRLDFYWDDARTAAVSVPVGDFFGVGLGRMAPFESALFSSPEARSFNALVPMPFRRSMRILLVNETDSAQPSVYYDVDYTLGDRHGADMLYFHAGFRRENPTTLQKDFEILPRIVGKGRFLGTNIGVIADGRKYGKSWWGEGELKIYLDGDSKLPTLAGTGTEDYIGAGYSLGAYAHQYQGAPIVDDARHHYAFYRYHVADPVYFRKDIRVTMQQIGFLYSEDGTPQTPIEGPAYAAGPGLRELDLKKLPRLQLYERADDWSAVAYFYLDSPETPLPPLAPVAERVKGL